MAILLRLASAAVCALALAASAAAQTGTASIPATFVSLQLEGVSVFGPEEVRELLHLQPNAPLPESPEDLAGQLQHRYHREGYTKAVVAAKFAESSGTLTLNVDEGRLDAVAFEGVDQELAADLVASFTIRAGALYNTREIARAVTRLLAPSRGAVKLSHAPPDAHDSRADTDKTGRDRSGRPFDLVERNGRRTLVVHVRRDNFEFDGTWGTDAREDWYSPVDGLNLAFGFSGSIFDHRRFNHTFIDAFVSYKFARETAGYSIGFERPIVGGPDNPRVFLAAEAHDLTASDDFWRLSVAEQSLVSLSFRNSFRDYYDARGYQVSGIFRPVTSTELVASWRAERHEPLANEAEFGLFRDEEDLRPNRAADNGRLRAVVLGFTHDTRGLDDESLRTTYRRHTGQRAFGGFGGRDAGVRFDWTSEIARPSFGGDFDFTRHIGNARIYVPLSPGQRLRGRLIAGSSTGLLPAQRAFGLGGIGTIHGYAFKEALGERMILGNLEYQIGSGRHAYVLGFLDVGRVYDALPDSRNDWMKGVGVGIGVGDLRVDFGWRADDIPKSLQVLVRFGPTF